MSNVQRPPFDAERDHEVATHGRSPDVGLWTLDFGLLPKLLSNLLSSEGPDAIEAEAEHHAVFLSDADVEGVVLGSHCAAVPTVAERDR